MPIFDYECKSCKNAFEEFAKAEDTITCPKCKKPAERLISACSFKCTGAGTYNAKMQVKGFSISPGICKADRDG